MSIATMFSIGALVFIISGLRIQALRMVNAEDFTYSKGYLGLLSALGASLGILGASLGITFCCAPAIPVLYHHCRASFLEMSHINERTTTFASKYAVPRIIVNSNGGDLRSATNPPDAGTFAVP